MGGPLAVADATAASRLQGMRVKNSPPGVHGQAGGLARDDTWVGDL